MEKRLNRQEWVTATIIIFVMPILIFSTLISGCMREPQIARWLILFYSICTVYISTVYVEGKSLLRRILMFTVIEIVILVFYAIGVCVNVILF